MVPADGEAVQAAFAKTRLLLSTKNGSRTRNAAIMAAGETQPEPVVTHPYPEWFNRCEIVTGDADVLDEAAALPGGGNDANDDGDDDAVLAHLEAMEAAAS